MKVDTPVLFLSSLRMGSVNNCVSIVLSQTIARCDTALDSQQPRCPAWTQPRRQSTMTLSRALTWPVFYMVRTSLPLVYSNWRDNALLIGAYLVIACTNIYLLYNKGSRILLVYTISLVCITTIYDGVAINYARTLLIDNPTSPDLLSTWPQVVVDSAYTVNNWLTDGYLVSFLWKELFVRYS